MRYVALLRGINLGPHRKVGMADLRRTLEKLGLDEVETYLRSGNVAFDTDEADPAAVREAIEAAIAAEFGFEVDVILRTAREMAAVVAENPYSEAAAADPTKVHAMFLSAMPPDDAWSALDPDGLAPEEFHVGDRVAYLHLPDGMARSELAGAVAKLPLGVVTTTRNWRTVLRLAEMTAHD